MQGQSTGMILADVKKAFDRVWHGGLLHKMIEFRFPPQLIKFIKSFLTNRKFAVNISNSTSPEHEILFGVSRLYYTISIHLTVQILSTAIVHCSLTALQGMLRLLQGQISPSPCATHSIIRQTIF